MRPGYFMSGLFGIAAMMPGAASADDAVDPDSSDEARPYYFAFDEGSLRRDIARIRNFYIEPVSAMPAVSAEAENSELVFLGGSASDGFAGFWDPGADLPPAPHEVGGSWFNRVEFGFGWTPELTDAKGHDARALTRSLAGLDVEKIGVRADLTALFRDKPRPGAGTSAWRVTGMLGSTSLSLAHDRDFATIAEDSADSLLWDIGIGWSNGPVSLSAGYQSIYSAAEGEAPGATAGRLSVGADYVVVPGFSVYGEFNLVDDPALDSEERLGTIVVIGTGLNF